MNTASKPGFNLIGYATSPIGLGEDLRSFAAMLDYLDIPFSIIDLPTDSSKKVAVKFKSMTMDTYENSMFFMSAMECQNLANVHPTLFSEPKKKLGYFLWELPDFPDEYVQALKLVDHIWCPTKFVQAAFFAKSRQLILSIPLPVIQAEPDQDSSNGINGSNAIDFRQALDIPKEAFVSLFMFDMRSTLNRKNPQATVEAFSHFAKGKKDAYLILKINRWQRDVHESLQWLPKSENIKIVKETLSPAQLTDLYGISNCYISLHRSEGFGRTLVEALQHGLWLISSNYSGPADYLTDQNAHLVSWEAKTVHKGDYPHNTHSTWADPSVAETVAQLEKLYAQHQQNLGKQPQRNQAGIETGKQFTLQALAEKYRPILMSYLR
jgi:glycosyltransferase involved in cell wall biosynthesis